MDSSEYIGATSSVAGSRVVSAMGKPRGTVAPSERAVPPSAHMSAARAGLGDAEGVGELVVMMVERAVADMSGLGLMVMLARPLV